MAKAIPTVYLETTFISYLTAWPSRDVIRLAQQQQTRDWWEKRREHFDLYCSELVEQEATAGDPHAAADRLVVVAQTQILAATEAAGNLANRLFGG